MELLNEIPTEFVNIRNSKNNYKYDIQKVKKPISLQNQIGELYNNSKRVNGILYIPRGLSVTERIFNNELSNYYDI